MFIITVLTCWALALVHLVLRTQNLLGLEGKTRWLLALIIFAIGLAYIPGRIMLARGVSEEFARAFTSGAALAVGFFAALWTLITLLEIGSIGYWILKRTSIWSASGEIGWWVAGGLWGTALLLTVLGSFLAHSTPNVTRIQLTIPDSEPQRWVMFSDTHLGHTSPRKQWRKTLQTIEGLEPDGLLIPGDLIDDSSDASLGEASLIREYFPELPIYITVGNHDLYSGLNHFIDVCEKLNFRLLRQELEELLPGLTVAGIDDGHLIDTERTVEDLSTRLEGPVLFMTHRPAAAHFLKDRPETLVLGAHTHGGQTLPIIFLVSFANGGFRSGLYQVGQAHLYLSNGAGIWGPPMRLVPPEILSIDITPGNNFSLSSLPN